MTLGDGLERHSPSLQSAAGRLQEATEQLVEHWTALTKAIDGLGPMVGEDVISQLIGGSLQGIREAAQETIQTVLDGYAGHGAAALEIDGNVATVEQASEQRAASIAKLLS
ncbi:hypothetical protein [Nonomuraea sp. NPDC049504]|uniref:hypothetical protein n=1 Tax=Nonomuraea sp. NPDC049504 TaxID=3154729 RepID=UPI003419F46A